MPIPSVVNILQEEGAINDELDYALMTYLLKNRGTGYTACQPSLVELEDGKKAIKMNIDNTLINKNNQLMGIGIVGALFIDSETLQVIYCTPKEELENNIEKLISAGYKPQPRPRGKY
ncbi:MAG: hypothetical protein ACTSPS_09145 [Promethearchaeota archaeon]